MNGVQAEVQLCKYLKARLDQSRAGGDLSEKTDQPGDGSGAVERELGGEVEGMMAGSHATWRCLWCCIGVFRQVCLRLQREVEALKVAHRRRKPGEPEGKPRERSGL